MRTLVLDTNLRFLIILSFKWELSTECDFSEGANGRLYHKLSCWPKPLVFFISDVQPLLSEVVKFCSVLPKSPEVSSSIFGLWLGVASMGKKIMIVDDSKTIRQQVSFTLQKGGYEVVEAEDGKDGLAKLQASPDIAMVISDVNMPNMNGLEMVEAIRADAKISGIPVVMLTTEGATDLIDRAKKAGAKGCLVKPFKPEQLVAAVQKLAG